MVKIPYLIGGTENDTYIVDNIADKVTENLAEGTDIIKSSVNYTLPNNVENLTLLGDENLTATGNNLANKLTGNSGNNKLIGNNGNDILSGGKGSDTLLGGAENDTYIVDNIGDKVTENLAEGTDLIKSTVNYTLPNNVENLTLLGKENITATGNNLDNKLTGNNLNNELFGDNGNDTLLGKNGNDILTGGKGNDTLTGGKGKDIFAYNLPTEGIDTITDFKRTQGDKIQIDRLGFGLENLAAGALQNDYFVLGNAAKDQGDRFIFNTANNTLFFDQDGLGGNFAQRAIAIISNDLNLKASDIILV